MKHSIPSLVFVLLGTLIIPIQARPENLLASLAGHKRYLDCGAQLNETIAAISYTADISVSSHERCVWVIRNPDAITYNLEVLSLGLQTSRDIGITATCILLTSTTLTHQAITATGVVTLGGICPILILTFFSGENVLDSRGFVMFYTSINGTHGISPDSGNYVFTNTEGHVRHPPNVESNYTDNDVSTFVFGPPNNVYTPLRRSLITYSGDSLEVTNCNDVLRLYKFSPATGWDHGAVGGDDYICGDLDYKSWTSDDMMMFIFRSSPSVTGRGFDLTHTEIS